MARATVDVSLRADIKDLVDNLNKVQGVTKKEARAMVREMKKGYNQQVKAAKIAADSQIKSTKKLGKEAEKTAGHMTDQWQRMATESASIFGSGAGWLGDLEGTFDIARQSTEKFGNSWMAAGTVATAAIVGAVAAVRAFNDAQMQLIADVAAASDQLEDYVPMATLSRMRSFTQMVTDADAAISLLKFGSDDLRGSLEEVKQTQVGMISAGFPEWLTGVTNKLTNMEHWLEETGAGWARLLPMFWISGGALNVVGAVGKEVEQLGKSAVESAKGMRKAQADLNNEREYEAYLADLERQAEEASAKLRRDEEKAEEARNKAAALQAQADARARIARATKLSAQMQAELNEETAREERLEKEAFAALKAADRVGAAADARQLDARGKIIAAYQKEVEIIKIAVDLNGENAKTTQAAASAQAAYNAAIIDLDQQQTAQKIGLVADSVNQLAFAASTFAGLALDRFSELADAERERFETNLERRTEAQREEVAAQLEAGEISEAAADAALTRIDLHEESRKKYHKALTKDQRKAAMTAFRVGQAAALAGVAASGAQAYMSLLASMAYLGFGSPAAAAAITGPAVIAQTAVVLAQKPPQFSDGGMVTPDHRLISAQPGEAVVSRRGVAALGGPSGLSELNKGMGSGGSMTANIVIDRRIIGQAVADIVPSSMTRRSGRIAVYGG